MPRDVFISHSAQDKKSAEAICAALEQNGVACWVAPRDVRPGKSFPGEITRAIQQCKVMLLIFSQASNSSEQVLREVQLAVDCHLPIVRLRIADVPLSDDLRYYLSTPHWLDALTPPLTKHIPALVTAIKELLGPATDKPDATPPPSASRTSAPAPEKKSVATRPAFVIAWAAVVIAALAFAVWMRSAKKAPVIPTPSPAQITPSPTIAPSPTATVPPSPTALAIAPSPTLTAPEKTETPEPKPSPSPPPRNEKAPAPRNNRDWQVWIDEFVHNFIASNETNDLDLAASFYAPSVDLFEEGRKPIEAIRQDIEAYNARWPSRRATIRGDVRMNEKAPNRSYTASFEHDYYVENASRGEWINGAVAVDLQIMVESDGTPKIVSMKQKTLRKDKGTMKPKPAAQAEPINSPTPASISNSTKGPAATLASPSSTATEPPEDGGGQAPLVRVRNTRYGFSALIPQNIFPAAQTTFTADRQTFTSADSRAVLTLYVERNGSAQHLRQSYEQWSAQHTKNEPDKIVDYKVLRDSWFVVSGQKGERGFYLKAVAKRDVLEFMLLDCDENHYPVNQETLTAMSRSFDGN